MNKDTIEKLEEVSRLLNEVENELSIGIKEGSYIKNSFNDINWRIKNHIIPYLKTKL